MVVTSLLTELSMQDFGHRVRLATHANFKEFVLTAGLEFYPLGGDPKILAGCMFLNFPLVLKLIWQSIVVLLSRLNFAQLLFICDGCLLLLK